MNEKLVVKSNRIDWIDIAKGFAILLVIIGHSSISGWLRGGILLSYAIILYCQLCDI
jgi:fucose 4-O-acetylase-like acetyltransferase